MGSIRQEIPQKLFARLPRDPPSPPPPSPTTYGRQSPSLTYVDPQLIARPNSPYKSVLLNKINIKSARLFGGSKEKI